MQVAANPDGLTRQGDILVNGERARIRQDAAPCRFELSATEQTMPADGGSGRLTVTAAAGCAWSARADASWVVITAGANGTGTGSISFTIAPNLGEARSASLVVADQTVKVTQPANLTECSVAVAPEDVSVPASGTNASSISVSAPPSCEWSASSHASWISITGRASGTGNGTVTFSVARNSGAARSGSITIGDQTVAVSQAGTASCSYVVTPLTTSIAAAGGTGTPIAVDTQTGCAWTAVSNATWLSITSGANSTGDGSVAFSASANTGAARTGTMSVAGQTVTVSQSAASCAYTISPTTVSVAAAGSTDTSISVKTTSSCAWTAASNASWLSITSGATGTGNGDVAVTVEANTGAARTGTLTVASQTVTVNQAAAPCSYSVSPTTVSISALGGTGTPISVSTSSGCTWTATSKVSWVSILTGASGTGEGNVTYSVQTNTGAARTGTLTVAGQTVTISQSGACVYAISPTSQTIEASGGSGKPVSVTTQAGCTWTAVSNVSWITVTSGASGTGSGNVTFTVAANNTGANRMGTLTIAGLTFTVNEKK